MTVSEKYKLHIDGLRAIAVISVVLFHLGLTSLSGGFTGVDIFFVISGFLISRYIYQQVDLGGFSLVEFYERRARRILPALFVVSTTTLVFVYALFLPSELVNFSKSLLASYLFSANIYFYSFLDYFAPAAGQLPLLHYWSLGVEEQFYIFFPLLIMAIAWLRPGMRGPSLFILAALSLVASQIMLQNDTSAAFYLLPFRAFELLIGSIIALPSIQSPKNVKIASGSTLAGILLVILSLLLISEQRPFPGYVALLPCIGTALILWGSDRVTTWPAKILSLPPMVFFGKISYSMYLIHWPFIVIAIRSFPETNPWIRGALIFVGSSVLAYLSYRFVESPFRRNRVFWNRRSIFTASAASIVAVVAVSGSMIYAAGFPGRLDESVAKVMKWRQYNPTAAFRGGKCFLEPNNEVSDFDQQTCLPTSGKTAIMWGDSTVAQYYTGLSEQLQQAGFSVGQLTSSLCPPIVGVVVAGRPKCPQFNEFAIAQVLRIKPDLVVLGASWQSDPVLLTMLGTTLDTLKANNIKAVVLGQTPSYRIPVPELLAERMMKGNASTRSDGDFFTDTLFKVDEQVGAEVRKHPGIGFISVLSTVCPQQSCPLVAPDGESMHFDIMHMTPDGSRFFASKIISQITKPVY